MKIEISDKDYVTILAALRIRKIRLIHDIERLKEKEDDLHVDSSISRLASRAFIQCHESHLADTIEAIKTMERYRKEKAESCRLIYQQNQ